jgi:hypothetical protein
MGFMRYIPHKQAIQAGLVFISGLFIIDIVADLIVRFI